MTDRDYNSYQSNSSDGQAYRSEEGSTPSAPPDSSGVYGAPPVPPRDGSERPTQPYESGNTSARTAHEASQGSHEKTSSPVKTFLLSFGGAALACIIFLGGYSLLSGTTGSTTVLGSTSSTEITAADEDATLPEQVADKCLPSVVSVYVYTDTSSYGPGLMSNSTSEDELVESALGSGVIISEDGYILTNDHVIEGADALKVNIQGTEYDAEIVGTDSSSDVAVIKAQGASGLTAIEIGDSDALTVGEWVMTIGSPYGYEQSVATGIVSATNRSQVLSSDTDGSARYYANMIQVDAAINSGNSGGALVDADGKLIGINTLITSSSGSFSGVGFAIPINYAMSLAEQIINGETPSHAQLGVSTISVTSEVAQRYNLPTDSGAYVSVVQEGSAAAYAGIESGDIITQLGDTQITSSTELALAVRSHSVGDTVNVTFNRNGEEKTVEVTLASDS